MPKVSFIRMTFLSFPGKRKCGRSENQKTNGFYRDFKRLQNSFLELIFFLAIFLYKSFDFACFPISIKTFRYQSICYWLKESNWNSNMVDSLRKTREMFTFFPFFFVVLFFSLWLFCPAFFLFVVAIHLRYGCILIEWAASIENILNRKVIWRKSEHIPYLRGTNNMPILVITWYTFLFCFGTFHH